MEESRVDESFSSEAETENKYFKKYNAILRRCKTIQKENEMLVNRVYQVKKIVRRLRKERKFLMEELDKKGDSFRSLPLTIAIEEEEKSFALPQANVKREKTERDPTAPKRPSNAFLQFCQEQKDVTAQYLQAGKPLDKKFNKVLAARWSVLSEDEKKVYMEKFERDKEHHSEERKIYENRKIE